MKKLLSMVLCAMMALTLAGCGGSSDDSSTYTYSSELDIKNLDSSDAEDGCSFTALHAIIDGLMKPAKDGTTTYGIAKSSEVSEDGLTHTYKLRDAKWSNGDAVTANDFVYAWQRIFKKKGNYYYMFCDGIASIAGAQELSDKIDAEQDLTDDDLNSLRQTVRQYAIDYHQHIELERKKTEEKEILDKKRKLESLIYQSHIQNDKKRKRKKTLRKTHLLKKVLRK